MAFAIAMPTATRSEEHTSELQSRSDLVCRLLLEKKKTACPRDRVRLRRLGRWSSCRDPSRSPRRRASCLRRRAGRLFFFNDRGPPEFYTLSLPGAFPI